MCTSTVLVADPAVLEHPAIAMVLFTVLRSGMAVAVVLAPEQPVALATVTLSGALWVLDAAVPVIVNPVVALLAVLLAETVTVVDAPAVTVAGEKDTVTPAGVVLEAKVIVSAVPLTTAVLAV